MSLKKMALLLLLPLVLILFVLLLLERGRKQKKKRQNHMLLAEAVATAIAQFKAGGIPYTTCPSCSDVLSVEVNRSSTEIGTINVRCRCGGSNAVIRI
jgi:preprotein translocase subunit YajC